MTTPKLSMPELSVGQAGKELTHNQALAILDQLAQAVVVDKDLATPPVSPANGAMYIVAAGATGAWLGQSGNLAFWLTSVGAWTFAVPVNGWSVWVTDEAVRYERKAGAWSIVAGAGGSGDILSTLTSPEVSITGAITLTASAFGKMHVCSGTSADYTVGLPAVSGNAGKIIGVRMAAGLAKIVTLDANASELIDGKVERVMWSGESAILLCDGVAWSKIAGKSVPLSCRLYPSAATTAVAGSKTLVPISVVTEDNSGAMANSGANRINIVRGSKYSIIGAVYFQGTAASSGLQSIVNLNAASGGAGFLTDFRSVPSGEPAIVNYMGEFIFSTGDYTQLFCSLSGGNRALFVNDPTWTFLSIQEIVQW